MNREHSKILEIISKNKAPLIRWDSNIYNGQEIDLLVHTESNEPSFIWDLFVNGWMLDKRLVNAPHLKLSFFDAMHRIAELDIVNELYVFDKSRLFRLLQNNNLNVVDINYSGYTVKTLADSERYILLLFHSIADKAQVVYKYYEQLALLRNTICMDEVNSLLKANDIAPSLFISLQMRYFDKTLRKFDRQKLYVSLGMRQPSNMLVGLVRKILRWNKTNFRRLFGCKFIVFMGADGSGKTTIINELMNTLGREKCLYLHLGNKSEFLPTTRIFNKYRRWKKSRVLHEPEEVKTRKGKRGLSVFKDALYSFNVHSEIFVHISYSLIKNIFIRRKYLLVDRYIYDRWITNSSVSKYRIFPQPDLIVLLDASTDILMKRKAEHSREMVEKFKSTYLEFCWRQNFSRSVRINTEIQLESCVNKINLILDETS